MKALSFFFVLLASTSCLAYSDEFLRGDLGSLLTDDTVITLQRSSCYGTCPAYEVIVFGDGTLVFNGYRDVKTIGPTKSRIDKSQLLNLLSAFRDFGYYNVEAHLNEKGKDCPEYWTDNPTASTSIRVSGHYKELTHYYGCQGAKIAEKATALESKIDEILGTTKWIGK